MSDSYDGQKPEPPTPTDPAFPTMDSMIDFIVDSLPDGHSKVTIMLSDREEVHGWVVWLLDQWDRKNGRGHPA